MKVLESIFRFIGCLIVSYIFSGLVDGFFIGVFHLQDHFWSGVIVGGITVGTMVYYFQTRKIKSIQIEQNKEKPAEM